MLYRLLYGISKRNFSCDVISLIAEGEMGRKIRGLGISVTTLGMKRGFPDPRGLARIVELFNKRRPHIVQTWMYHADLLGGIAAKLAGRVPVIWGVHHTDLSPDGNKNLTILTAKICARLSTTIPSRIFCCSVATAKAHEAIGYDANRLIVIPNGYDTEIFRPDHDARISVRAELGLSNEMILIGLVGRVHQQKDHRNFIDAAKLLSSQYEGVHFLLCGYGTEYQKSELNSWIDDAKLRDRFHLLGQRDDMPRIYAALDIGGISSYGEAFPNVVAEAMACGVPCVVTDVGDSSIIVEDTGIVVPPKDSAALAAGWAKLVDLGQDNRIRLGAAARQRIVENYSLASVTGKYEEMYRTVLQIQQ